MTLLTGLLIVFTPVRELIPGYLDPNLKSDARELRSQVDTLEAVLKQQEEIIRSFAKIDNFELKQPSSFDDAPEYTPDSNQSSRDFPKPEDPTAGSAVEAASTEPHSLQEYMRKPRSREVMNLVPPVDGLITNKFNPSNPEDPHYGLDLVADESSLIKACADGVVIFSEFSNTTGYVVGIAHTDYNLISFYKHNSRVFKKVGSHVFSGEAIAVIGNSGKNTSGPHLHFELWYENSPVNPEDYIIFK
jgi:murein DD-endopeptidase MepM/ murein hydrolase activator NlpD